MTITQTIEVPVSHRLTIDIPREVPAGPVVIEFKPAAAIAEAEECPICAKHRDPVTGELRFNEETIAAMQEVDDMLAGKIPNTLKKFNSFDEMWEYLNQDEEDED